MVDVYRQNLARESSERAKELAVVYINNGYSPSLTTTELGLTKDKFRHSRDRARKLGLLPDEPRSISNADYNIDLNETRNKVAKEFAEVFTKNNYDVKNTMLELGISRATFKRRKVKAKELDYLPNEINKNAGGVYTKRIKEMERVGINPEDIETNNYSILDIYDIYDGDKISASKLIGISIEEFNRRMEIETKFSGQDDETPIILYPTPSKGKVKRYIITSAQNNTDVHRPTFDNLIALSKYYKAEFIVGTYSYNKGSFPNNKSVKRNKSPTDDDRAELFYATEIEDYLNDDKIRLQDNLIYCGNMNTLPTATNPLSGLEGFTARDSAIFPHAKIAMTSVPSMSKQEATKFNYTTGTVTKRNYIQKKAGIKAEKYHTYGGLLVEVSDDSFFVRQLETDIHGCTWDVGSKYIIKVINGEVIEHQPVLDNNGKTSYIKEVNVTTGKFKNTKNKNIVEAINPGDIHEIHLEAWMRNVFWGDKNSVVNYCKPKYQLLHDVIDFRSRNHHDRGNPLLNYEKNLKNIDDVEDELKSYAAFMDFSAVDNCLNVVVDSNHHNAVVKWLSESDAIHKDPKNAYVYVKGWYAYMTAINDNDKSFNILQWAYEEYSDKENIDSIKWLNEGESFVICKNQELNYSGIECGIHGHLGIAGSRGNPTSYTKLGRYSNTGHTHAAGIYLGVATSGIQASLDLGYNKGLDKWSQSFIITYSGGSRQIATIWKQKWRAN